MSDPISPQPWSLKLWHIDSDALPRFDLEFGTDGEHVADCVYGEANAFLLLAAPDMLKALQLAVKFWDGEYNHDQTHVRLAMKKAIAKAEGKEQS